MEAATRGGGDAWRRAHRTRWQVINQGDDSEAPEVGPSVEEAASAAPLAAVDLASDRPSVGPDHAEKAEPRPMEPELGSDGGSTQHAAPGEAQCF